MNARALVFPLLVMLAITHGFASHAAIINVEEPQPEGFRIGASASVDLNRDGTTDLWINYYDIPLCYGPPEGGSYVCSLGASIGFAPQLSLLAEPSSLAPVALLPGQSVGPSPSPGVWLSPIGSPISLIYQYGTVSHYPQGFPEFTRDLRRLAIGFRLAEQQSYYYGFLDVSLWRPSFTDPGYETPVPRIEGVFLSDLPDVGVTVSQVPEPSTGLLLVVGVFWGRLVWRSRKP